MTLRRQEAPCLRMSCGMEIFIGLLLPLGCEVHFLSPSHVRASAPKFDPKTCMMTMFLDAACTKEVSSSLIGHECVLGGNGVEGTYSSAKCAASVPAGYKDMTCLLPSQMWYRFCCSLFFFFLLRGSMSYFKSADTDTGRTEDGRRRWEGHTDR